MDGPQALPGASGRPYRGDGCTGACWRRGPRHDPETACAALLEKGGDPIDTLAVAVDGELSKGQPMRYTSIHLIYDMSGPAVSGTPAMHAVETSQRGLCGVSAMLQDIMPVSWEVRFNGHLIHTGRAGLEARGLSVPSAGN